MADSYEEKAKELEKYVPYLESLISKIKNNKGDKRESQLDKFEKLHSLLTNKEKKLKLETLEKCEAVLIKLCKKIEKTDIAPANSPIVTAQQTDVTAPDSPSESTQVVQEHNPIVIPTERRETPPPDMNEIIYNRNRTSSGNFSASSNASTTNLDERRSCELFRRRSPNRDRSTQYDELRKKYETPPVTPLTIPTIPTNPVVSPDTYSSYNEYSVPRSRLNTVRTSYTTSVLKSPPLTMDDLKDLMSDVPPPLPKGPPPAPVPAPVPPPVPPPVQIPDVAHVPPPVQKPDVAPVQLSAQMPIPTIVSSQVRIDPRPDRQWNARVDPRLTFPSANNVVNDPLPRVDPRNAARPDPRLNRDMNQPQSMRSPSQDMDPRSSTNPPVRLAYKYNPHPRREAPPPKPNDYDLINQGIARPDDNRSVNHLPSVNPSDPRLRNRQLPMLQTDRNLSPQMGGNLTSPVGNMSSPMSPIANFMDPTRNPSMNENHNSARYGCGQQQFFGNFPSSNSMHMPSNMMSNNSFMGSGNNFKPQPPVALPRTYGEYRKFRQKVESVRKQNQGANNKANNNPPQRNSLQNHSPLETTVKPMQFSSESKAPSVLDTMYRNTDFAKDTSSSSVQSFKIPKIRKEPEPTADSNKGKVNQLKTTDKEQSNDSKTVDSKTNKDKTATSKEKDTKQALKQNDKKEEHETTKEKDKNVEAKKPELKKSLSKDDKNAKSAEQPKKLGAAEGPVKPTKKRMVIESDESDWDSDPADSATVNHCTVVSETESEDAPIAHPEDSKNKSSVSKKPANIPVENHKKKDNVVESKTSSVAKENNSKDTNEKQKPDTKTQIEGKKTPGKNESAKKTDKQISKKDDKDAAEQMVDHTETSNDSDANVTDKSKRRMSISVQNKRRMSVAGVEKRVVNDICEASTDSDASVVSKKTRKRKSDATTSKIPAKLTKAGDVKDSSAEHEQHIKPQSSTSSNKDASKKEDKESERKTKKANDDADQSEDDSDEELPDTIINSEISSKNIIEGRRRTRGSARFDTSMEATVPTSKPPTITPPKKGARKSDMKSLEDSSPQECSVSSTTSSADPETEEKKGEQKTVTAKKKTTTAATKKTATTSEEKPQPTDSEATTSTSSAPTTSSSVSQQKDEITKEWLEGFLINLFNPSQMSSSSVLAMLEKVLDADKFQQVKKILCPEESSPSTAEEQASSVSEKPTTTSTPTTSQANESCPKSGGRTGRRKNELDRLNEDIRDMFICQGVLTASGRRMCSAISEKESALQLESESHQPRSGTPSSTKAKAKPAAKPTVKEPVPKGPKRRGRRSGLFWKGSKKGKAKGRGRQRKDPHADESEEEDQEMDEDGDADPDRDDFNDADDDMPLSLQIDTKSKAPEDSETEEELLKIVVGGDSTQGKTPVPDEKDIESRTMDEEAAASLNNTESEVNEIAADTKIESTPIVLLRRMSGRGRRGRGRGRGPSNVAVPSIQIVEPIKNTNSDMHVQSEYNHKCVLCAFTGPYICNHYVRFHPDSEVYISRLPPHNQTRLLANLGNTARGLCRKPPNRILYMFVCPFCDQDNAFTRLGWIDHFATHTGEYTYRCMGCGKVMNCQNEMKKHLKNQCPKAEVVRLRAQMPTGSRIHGHLCTLCNYVQMDEKRVIEHLHTQHNCFDEGTIKQVILLDYADAQLTQGDASVSSAKSQEPVTKQAKLDGMESVGADRDTVADASQNLEIFVTNEQNDVALDTNIIQFMRDVSFSAQASPPRQSTMSVADRITERLKNVTTQPDQSSPTTSKAMSMADRLSKRFGEESSTMETTSSEETTGNDAPTTHEVISIADRLSKRFSEEPGTIETTTMSVADRITDRLENETTQPDQATPTTSKVMSMADRLSKRFGGNPSTIATTSNEETTISDTSTTPKVISIQKHPKAASNAAIATDKNLKVVKTEEPDPLSLVIEKLQCRESLPSSDTSGSPQIIATSSNDVIVISDGEENSQEVTESSTIVDDEEDVDDDDDDDDDWEDIETLTTTPSCVDGGESKASTSDNKMKKNKQILSTLSRLYASIAQPKSKPKSSTSTKINKSGPLKKNVDDDVDLEKCYMIGLKRINQLGFQLTDQLKYHCLIKGCSFLYSDSSDGLKFHVIGKHYDVKWNGFCHICNAQVTNDGDKELLDELRHMQEVHIDKMKSPVSRSSPSIVKTSATSGILKIRRLSGDMLSGDRTQISPLQPSVSTLQIASAVSLNRNADKTLVSSSQPSPILQISSAISLNKNAETWKSMASMSATPIVVKQVNGPQSIVINANTNQSPSKVKIANAVNIATTSSSPTTSVYQKSTTASIVSSPEITATTPKFVSVKGPPSTTSRELSPPVLPTTTKFPVTVSIQGNTLVVNKRNMENNASTPQRIVATSSSGETNTIGPKIVSVTGAAPKQTKFRILPTNSNINPLISALPPSTTLSCGSTPVIVSVVGASPQIKPTLSSAPLSNKLNADSSPKILTAVGASPQIKTTLSSAPLANNLNADNSPKILTAVGSSSQIKPTLSSAPLANNLNADNSPKILTAVGASPQIKPTLSSASLSNNLNTDSSPKILTAVGATPRIVSSINPTQPTNSVTANSAPKIVSVVGGLSQIMSSVSLIQPANNANSATSTPKIVSVVGAVQQTKVSVPTNQTKGSTPPANQANMLMTKPLFHNQLKPWLPSSKVIKTINAANILLQYPAIMFLYKCTGVNCAFAVNSELEFLDHLYRNTCKQLSSQQECWYCDATFPTAVAMGNHIKQEHAKDIYQCNYCVYRSCEKLNVSVHQKEYHSHVKEYIRICPGDKSHIIEEPGIKFQEFVDKIKPIACNECPETFISLTEFTTHVYTHVMPPLIRLNCAYCTPEERLKHRVTVGTAIGHLYIVHRIGYYVCIFCPFQAAKRSEMHLHMANMHASKFLFCCIRAKHHTVKEEIYASLPNGMTVVKLSEVPDSTLTRRDTNTEIADTFSVQQQEEKDKLGRKVFLEPRLVAASQVDNVGQPSQSQSITSSDSEGHDTEGYHSSMTDTIEDRATKILNAAEDIVRNTGEHIDKLFKCGVPDCGLQFDLNKFRNHLATGHMNQKKYCAHCDQSFGKIMECVSHYYTHERHRYFCFLCFQTDRSAGALAHHFGKEHAIKSKFTVMTYALLKGHVNAKTDFFFVCPNSVKAADICRFGDRLLKMWERKKWAAMKKSFDVDEIEKLPRQAIFLEELYCAVCQYKTKVRTNLYRHLLFHKNEVNVANIDPVNPVPCLNSAEKHFDKMTNLACSSHANKAPASTTSVPGTSGDSSQPSVDPKLNTSGILYNNLPTFIPVPRRFICGMADCPYVALSEQTLRQHLNVVHCNDKVYACPHCKAVICTTKLFTDKIIHHMKFHDAVLYLCDNCVYWHFHKPTMERHVRDRHRGTSMSYTVRNRVANMDKKFLVESQSSTDGATPPTPAEPTKTNDTANDIWQCMLCKRRFTTAVQVQAHMNTAHNIPNRYQCSKCNFGCNKWNAITEHARKRHINVMAEVICYYSKLSLEELDNEKTIDTTPLWRRDPNKVKNIRGILMEEEQTPVDSADDSSQPIGETENEPIASTTVRVGKTTNTVEKAETKKATTAISEESQSPVGKTPVEKIPVEKIPVEKTPVEKTPVEKTPVPPTTSSDNGGTSEPPVKNTLPQVEYFCQICYVFSAGSIIGLRAHMMEVHSENEECKDYLNKLFKFVCFHCSEPFAKFTSYQSHWESVHKTVPAQLDPTDHCHREGRTPWFTVWRNFQCSRCTAFDDYRELAIHHFLEHPKEQFATRDIDGTRKCGHCPYVYSSNVDELVEHYKSKHLPESQDKSKTPIPNPPLMPIPEAYLQDLTSLGARLQYFKCNICHTVLNDMTACKVHCGSLHDIHRTHPCTIMQGNLYKCPMCQFCSANEEYVLNHMFNKIKSGRFSKHESLTRPETIDAPIWPYTMMEVVFPNGFVIERYRLLGVHVLGKLDSIDQFLAKKTDRVVAPMRRRKSMAATRPADLAKDDGGDNDAEESNRPKRRLARRASTFVASIDRFGSDDEYMPSAPKKKCKQQSTTGQKSPSSKEAPVSEPYSYYGQKPEEIDLGSIIANVIVDGVKVMIPANDFRKLFKKDITLKLQKVNVDERRLEAESGGPSASAQQSTSKGNS